MLDVIDLECMRGGRRLISELNFSLGAGELLHLRGHNGSGKTTLLRTLCGLAKEDSGKVLWGGQSIRKLGEEYTREVTYIGHKNGIKEDLTGVENLLICTRLDGFCLSQDKAWEALAKMGLRGHEDLPTRVLSQGQKRRVALARLLVNRAKLWVLDEPFTALDVAAVDFLHAIIQGHIDGGGMVILTTHQEIKITKRQVKELKLGWKEAGRV